MRAKQKRTSRGPRTSQDFDDANCDAEENDEECDADKNAHNVEDSSRSDSEDDIDTDTFAAQVKQVGVASSSASDGPEEVGTRPRLPTLDEPNEVGSDDDVDADAKGFIH